MVKKALYHIVARDAYDLERVRVVSVTTSDSYALYGRELMLSGATLCSTRVSTDNVLARFDNLEDAISARPDIRLAQSRFVMASRAADAECSKAKEEAMAERSARIAEIRKEYSK